MDQPVDLIAAQRNFVAAVTRPEQHAPAVTRKAAEAMSEMYARAANVPSRFNIENAMAWTVRDITVAPSRIAAWRDLLYALSRSFCPRDPNARVDTTKPGLENTGLGKIVKGRVQQPPEPAFQRLHILYVVHSTLMHIRDCMNSKGSYWPPRKLFNYSAVLEQLRPTATTIARLAVCGCEGKAVATRDAVLHLVLVWRTRGIFSANHCDEMDSAVREAADTSWEDSLQVMASEEEEKKLKGTLDEEDDWIVPDRHSNVDNPSAPWHELPATNALLMKRTRGYPMRAIAFPNGGFEIENDGSKASHGEVQSIKALYRDVMHCFEKYTDPDEVHDIDAMGNITWKDSELLTTNQWGWSLDDMPARKELAADFARDATGYADLPASLPAGVNSAVERAKALAAERNGGDMGGGFGLGGDGFGGEKIPGFDGGRGGFRGGGRGRARGGYRGDFRGGFRGRGRW